MKRAYKIIVILAFIGASTLDAQELNLREVLSNKSVEDNNIQMALFAEFLEVETVYNNCEEAYMFCEDRLLAVTNVFDEDTTLCTQSLYFFMEFEDYHINDAIYIETDLGETGIAEFYGPFYGSIYEACGEISLSELSMVSDSLGTGSEIAFDSDGGKYILKITFSQCGDVSGDPGVNFNLRINGDAQLVCNEDEIPCEDCITSFQPSPGRYVVSGWVMEDGAPISTTTYTNSGITVSFIGDAAEFELEPSGQIIDGWQRIEEIITVPSGATDILIALEAESGTTAYFDDIRFFPLDGSMMSYVYDPESLRLMAELDERNYATLYEYDEEGKLVRVKKETERGVMTIQENRDNIKKQ